jgi:abortive infection bacteriophage resistance protein
MVISDDALAQSYLNKIGYYRLSGYWYPYRQSEMKGEYSCFR